MNRHNNIPVQPLGCLLLSVLILIASIVALFCDPVHGATEHTSHGKELLPNHDSQQYKNYYTYEHSSGYVLIDPISQKHYWYYFQQATTNPSEKPLILFLNGGPGCSSMEYFGSGIGNANVSTSVDGKVSMLEDNFYSWNQFANVIYLDAPSGVGFSYATDTSVYEVNSDSQTAHETRIFLMEFLTHYSQFRNSELYISGASYGGKYVPNLAKLILDENVKNEFVINLKGITLGNPLINWQQNAISSTLYFQSIGMISKSTVDEVSSLCGWNDPDNWVYTNMGDDQCKSKFMTLYMNSISGLNIYNLFKDSCNVTQNLNSFACHGEHLKRYMNLNQVQSFFKIRNKVDWDACYPNNNFFYGFDEYANGLPTLQYLIEKKSLKILIYTGDMDGSTSVRTFYDVIDKVPGLSIKENITTWSVDYQIAGRKTVYDGFTYATVRGAGHIAPLDQPARVYALVSNFIKSGSIPDSVVLPELPEPDQINTSEVIALKTLTVIFIISFFIALIIILVLAICLCRQHKLVKKSQNVDTYTLQ